MTTTSARRRRATLHRPLHLAAVVVSTAVVASWSVGPALAADGSGDVAVTNTETVQVYTSPSGEVETRRVYEQLMLEGRGTVEVSNPVSTDGLRNLDGFGDYEIVDGEQVTTAYVDGTMKTRSVSDFEGDLPLSLAISYTLDGDEIDPEDLVGRSGHLEVSYTVTNVSGEPTEVSYSDGRGGTITETVDVPIPMVGSLTTVVPSTFNNVTSGQANMAGDGKGGTKLSFTMTLIPPVGSDTATFGYEADVVDAVVPRGDMSALPVNPLESPTFASAASSYQGGADTGQALTAGAVEIDSNLLKLRDGAGDLLAGLVKLRDGAAELQTGLAGQAAPGSEKLADGAASLADGLGRLDEGAGDLADGLGDLDEGAGLLADGSLDLAGGAGKVDAGVIRLGEGTKKLDAGAGRLADGTVDLKDGTARLRAGTGAAVAGGQKLTGGLQQISDGLGSLGGVTGLPAAQQGATALQAGVDQILAGLGDAGDPATLVGGLTQLSGGLGAAQTGAGTIVGGLTSLRATALVPSKAGVDQVMAGLQGAVDSGASADAIAARVRAIASLPTCQADPACLNAVAALTATLGSVDAATKASLRNAVAGLQQVSGGLGQAIGALDSQLIPGATTLASSLGTAKSGAERLTAGASAARAGLIQVKGGLTQLQSGLATATAGVLALSTGADSALQGSTDLTAGLTELNAGAGDLDTGAGKLAGGAGELVAGTSTLVAGAAELGDGTGALLDGARLISGGAADLAAGAGRASSGATELAAGATDASNGSGRLSAGASDLAAGLGAAASGSTQLANGLVEAADGAPQLVDGAQRLSDEGTSKLIEAGEGTTQEYGLMYATMAAGAERAQTDDMAYGAPQGARGLTAYSFVIEGNDGEEGRNMTRGLAALGVLGAAGGLLLARRRLL